MTLEELQGAMNKLYGELLLASDERQVVILMLLADLARAINSQANLRIQKIVNAVGDEVTPSPEQEEDLTGLDQVEED